MKPIEILSAIPEWAKASPEDILASPAWAMPCRLGEEQCVMRPADVRPAETLDLAIRLGEEDHVLGIADSPMFAEIHSIWTSRADVPEPMLIAMVEKDCGAFLQLLENVARRQLRIIGLSQESAPRTDAQMLFAQVSSQGETATFSLDLTPAIIAEFGKLRNIDTTHETVRGFQLPAEREYAVFTMPDGDLATLAPGDEVLIPEAETIPPRIVAARLFSLSGNGVAPWKDDGLLRVCAAEGSTVSLGELLDAAAGTQPQPIPPPKENEPLNLVRNGRTVASGHFAGLAGHPSFSVDASRLAR